MSSSVRALDLHVARPSTRPAPAERPRELAAATRTLELWWRYRDSDLSIDQGLYLKLPSAEERLLVRDRDGNLKPLPEDAEPGRDFLVEGRTGVELGQLAEVIGAWLTLSMRRFYLRAPCGRFLELSKGDAVRRDVLIRRLDAFLSAGAGPYRVLAVALRSEWESDG